MREPNPHAMAGSLSEPFQFFAIGSSVGGVIVLLVERLLHWADRRTPPPR